MKVVAHLALHGGHWKIPDPDREALERRFPGVQIASVESLESLAAEIGDATRSSAGACLRAALRAARRLRWIHSASAGIEASRCFRRWSPATSMLTNSTGLHSICIPEHVVGQMLVLGAQLPRGGAACRRAASGTGSSRDRPPGRHARAARREPRDPRRRADRRQPGAHGGGARHARAGDAPRHAAGRSSTPRRWWRPATCTSCSAGPTSSCSPCRSPPRRAALIGAAELRAMRSERLPDQRRARRGGRRSGAGALPARRKASPARHSTSSTRNRCRRAARSGSCPNAVLTPHISGYTRDLLRPHAGDLRGQPRRASSAASRCATSSTSGWAMSRLRST